ncbi:ABC transporter ATP-binding protein [Paenibacillus sp. FSL K6-3182]|uniref:ABC transporter ATP-binding protein n=1 Tax=Paenibacillus sp. FSL K6-3182 TaxID=2921495 RepID=UPI0030D18D40
MITVQNLSKIYKIYDSPTHRLKEVVFGNIKQLHKEFHALKDVGFEIKEGETIGIVGKNGSGKSTLLKILTGVLNHTSGNVVVNGKISAILELGAGFNVEYSGMENIYLNGTLQGKSRKEIDNILPKILEFAEIGEFIYQPVKTYSSGMFARLAFAVAINVNPDILIVDEALAVGDMKFQTKCFKKFEELKNQGVTILFVGHDVSSIRKFCDRTIWLHQGKLIAFGDTLSVTAEYMEFMNTEDESEPVNKLQIENLKIEEAEAEANIFEQIINRWGSQPNLLKSVQVINEKGRETSVIKHGETIRIKVKFKLPDIADLTNVSVALSIKNTMGLDLLVFTTKDDDEISISEVDVNGEITFEFVNFFVNGDFVLVVAIEDRSHIQPQYFDYIEGAAYIKSISDKQLFGIIHTPVRKQLRK